MPANKTSSLYWRLSSFYLFYFASLGAIIPYWSLYLKDIGFTPLEISELMAIIMGTKIISPNIWGWIADHTGKRMAIVRSGSLLAAICFIGVFADDKFWWLVLVLLGFSFFWNATLPQFEATTLHHLDDKPHRYSAIRLWGSVGFIATVAALGPYFELYSIQHLPVVIFILLSGIWLSSLIVPEKAAQHLSLSHVSLREILLRPEVITLILVCFLAQASHGGYYTFYTLFMESHQYSRTLIGALWALGVVAEVGVFLYMHRLVPKYGLRNLFLATFILTTIRWILIASFIDSMVVAVVAQVLHAASFGLYHAVAIQLFHRYFPGKHAGKGQALYSSLSFGAGGAFGTYISGLAWEHVSPASIFMIAAGLSTLAFVLSWRWLRNTD